MPLRLKLYHVDTQKTQNLKSLKKKKYYNFIPSYLSIYVSMNVKEPNQENHDLKIGADDIEKMNKTGDF